VAYWMDGGKKKCLKYFDHLEASKGEENKPGLICGCRAWEFLINSPTPGVISTPTTEKNATAAFYQVLMFDFSKPYNSNKKK
jgi:hypothetical protein